MILLACRVQWYECLGRYPRTQSMYFLCFGHFKHPILGIQKHICWPMGYSGMGVCDATLELKQYFLALRISNTSIPGIRKHLRWLVG